jgi:putative RecB family exonuclease
MPDHLSYSQISLYLECPLLYKLRYIEGEKGEAIPAALVFGSAIHKALAGFYTDVMDGEPFVLSAFLGAFEEAWSDAVEEREIIYKEGEDFDSLLGLGRQMLKVFARSVMPQKVIAVEVPFEFRLEHPITGDDSSVPLKGVIDLIEEDESGMLWVVDHKTAGRAYSEPQIAGDLQMLIYAAAVKQLDVVEGREVMLRFDVLTKSKKPKFLRYPMYRDGNDIARLFEIVEGVWKAIEAEAFYPRCCIHTWFGRVHEECVRDEAR